MCLLICYFGTINYTICCHTSLDRLLEVIQTGYHASTCSVHLHFNLLTDCKYRCTLDNNLRLHVSLFCKVYIMMEMYKYGLKYASVDCYHICLLI